MRLLPWRMMTLHYQYFLSLFQRKTWFKSDARHFKPWSSLFEEWSGSLELGKQNALKASRTVGLDAKFTATC